MSIEPAEERRPAVPGPEQAAVRPPIIPAVLTIGVFLLWAAFEGGFNETAWLPGGIFLLGLLAITAFAYRGWLATLPSVAKVALAFLTAFTLWCFASILWADVPATAWAGANRALLYTIAFALFLVPTWRPVLALQTLALYALGLAAIGIVILVETAGSPDAALVLVADRFGEPTGYPNGVAALFVGGFWPALLDASRREVPWPVRGLALGTAGLLIQLALLPQSRGSLIVLPIAVVLYVAIAPERLRALQALLAVGVATLLASGPILDVFATSEAEGDIGAALAEARDAIALSFLGLTAIGMCIGLTDRRIRPSATVVRVAGAGSAAAALALVVALLVVIGNPFSWASERWEDFKRGYESTSFEESRLTGDLGSNRYDFWRVAWEEEFEGSPIVGAGAENFEATYLRERTSGEEPTDPHSLPLMVLAGTGIVGGLLFLGFWIATILGVCRARWPSTDPLTAGIAATSIVAFGYWALHSSGDWLWSFPAISAPVFTWLAMSISLTRGETAAAETGRAQSSRRSWPLMLGAAVAAIVAVASFALPWGAARDTELAVSGWTTNPQVALDRLERARSLNFLSAEPDILAGTIAVRLGDDATARTAFERALRRQPDNWFARLQLGTLAAVEGDRATALSQLSEAIEANPRDSLLQKAYRRARRGNPLELEDIDRELAGRVCDWVGRTSDTDFCE